MTMNDNQTEAFEALAAKAVTVATELSLALDKEPDDSHPSICQLRNLAVLAFDTMSKIVVLLVKKDSIP